MTIYLDSSVLLRALLARDPILETVGDRRVVSSRVLELECHRVVDRYRMERLIDDEQLVLVKRELEAVLKTIDLVEIDETIFQKACGAFPTVIKSLDALHVATCVRIVELFPDRDLVLWSYDRGLLNCAQALKIACGPNVT